MRFVRVNNEMEIVELFPVGFVPSADNLHPDILKHCWGADDDVAMDWVMTDNKFAPPPEEEAPAE